MTPGPLRGPLNSRDPSTCRRADDLRDAHVEHRRHRHAPSRQCAWLRADLLAQPVQFAGAAGCCSAGCRARRGCGAPCATGGRALWISGLCWCVMYTAFMVAITLTTVANVLVTMAMAPLLTAMAARVALGHRLALRTWAAIVVAGAGIAWMYGCRTRRLRPAPLDRYRRGAVRAHRRGRELDAAAACAARAPARTRRTCWPRCCWARCCRRP